MTELTNDQRRTLERELRQRDPRFLRIASTNVDEGQGEYEVRSATTGMTLRRVFTFEGSRILTPLFDKASYARRAAAAEAVPDPYAAPLAAMRTAASETTALTFEQRWKAERFAALATEYAKIDAPPARRLTQAQLAELEEFTPPNPYQLALAQFTRE